MSSPANLKEWRAGPGLVVDDVEEMAVFLAETLKARGYAGVEAASGVRGAETRILRNRPAWVLLDEWLPTESALDAAEAWARLGIAVVLMSGSQGREDEPLPPGVRARVTKPDLDGADAEIFHWEWKFAGIPLGHEAGSS